MKVEELKAILDPWMAAHPREFQLYDEYISGAERMEHVEKSCWKKVWSEDIFPPDIFVRHNFPPFVLYLQASAWTKTLQRENIEKYDEEVNFNITREKKLERITKK